MKDSKKILIGLLILCVIGVGSYFVFLGDKDKTASSKTNVPLGSSETTSQKTDPAKNTEKIVVQETSVVEDTPAVQDTTTIEQTSVVEETSVVEDATESQNTPAVEDAPVVVTNSSESDVNESIKRGKITAFKSDFDAIIKLGMVNPVSQDRIEELNIILDSLNEVKIVSSKPFKRGRMVSAEGSNINPLIIYGNEKTFIDPDGNFRINISLKEDDPSFVFNFNKNVHSTVIKSQQKSFDQLIRKMEKYENKMILVFGHTDDSGRDEYNFELSLKRGNIVENNLIESKFDLLIRPFGEMEPVESNETKYGQGKNRRIEVFIIDNFDSIEESSKK
jgi:outer membrane protein OmpA-like peptidoglycan-associated protein